MGSNGAVWQFLITPEANSTQNLYQSVFTNSESEPVENSINGYGFPTHRISTRKQIKEISFTGEFTLLKDEINPFENYSYQDTEEEYKVLDSLELKSNFETFLRETRLTALPPEHKDYFDFDTYKRVFENLQILNEKVYRSINFTVGITHTETTIKDILKLQAGVCQDFAHLFCAVARKNKVPTRYVSGYLHQGNGFFGDSQMHAWVECYIPNTGWVGFDPTNNILADHNHIKVCHGKNYMDCSPLKGIVFTAGSNETEYKVLVSSQQQQ